MIDESVKLLLFIYNVFKNFKSYLKYFTVMVFDKSIKFKSFNPDAFRPRTLKCFHIPIISIKAPKLSSVRQFFDK